MDNLINAVFISAPNLGSNAIQVYDALTGASIHAYKGLQAAHSTISLTGGEEYVMCGCKERSLVQAWRIHKHDKEDLRLNLPNKPTAVAVPPGKATVMVVAISHVLHVYSLETGCRLAAISRHFQPVTRVVFFPCGQYFVSAGEDGFIYVWSMASIWKTVGEGGLRQNIQPFKQLGQHSDKITDLATRGGSVGRLVSCSSDHTARVYDLMTLHLLQTVVCDGEITTVHLTDMATRLALGLVTGQVAVVDLIPYNNTETIRVTAAEYTDCHSGAVSGVRLTDGGSGIITAGEDGEVKIWAVKQQQGALPSLNSNSSDNVYSLGHQRTIHRNKGPVTNLEVVLMERTIFNSSDRSSAHVAELSSLNSGVDCLTAPVTIRAATTPKLVHDPAVYNHMARWSTEHMGNNMNSLQYLIGDFLN